MKIQVFGAGCVTCSALYENVCDAVNNLDLHLEVEYYTDLADLISLGTMGSPVLVIDGHIKSVGRVPSRKEIEALLQGAQRADTSRKETDPSGGCSCGGSC